MAPLSDVAGTSVGVNEQEATKIASGTQAYLAFYFPGDNTGRLTANDLDISADGNNITIAPVSNWDASCNLTGVPALQSCQSTNVAGPTPAQSPNGRTMMTWDGGQGVAFRWNLRPRRRPSAARNSGRWMPARALAPFYSGSPGYLRGDLASIEINHVAAGEFRARDGRTSMSSLTLPDNLRWTADHALFGPVE